MDTINAILALVRQKVVKMAPVMKGSFVKFDRKLWGPSSEAKSCFFNVRGAAYREATAEYYFPARVTF